MEWNVLRLAAELQAVCNELLFTPCVQNQPMSGSSLIHYGYHQRRSLLQSVTLIGMFEYNIIKHNTTTGRLKRC